MLARLDPTRLLRYAGLFTWAVIGAPLLLLSLRPLDPGGDPVADLAAGAAAGLPWQAWLAWSVFGFSFAWLTRGLGARRPGSFDYPLSIVLTGCAIAVSYYTQSGLGSVLLMVSACVLPWLLPVPVGLGLLVVSELVILPIYHLWLELSWSESVMQAMLYVGFTGFVFVIGFVARQQAQARDEQRRLNAELRATRALLAESARVNERTRIARELHDLLGHHLTALSLNLEVANHLTQGQAREHVGQAHTLARLLLSDVREAVSQIRDNDAIDMAATLLPLADNVPGLRIDMQLPRPFLIDDPERAHVLLRCTQEIITNTVRHAQAQLLRLRYSCDGERVRLQARDDGRGAADASAGNGLRGMRERLAAYGGEVDIESAPGQGFALSLSLPLDGAGLRPEGWKAGEVAQSTPKAGALASQAPQPSALSPQPWKEQA